MFEALCEFSRDRCIAICAFLVPANLLVTSLTMIFTGLQRPRTQIWQTTAIANILAVTMIFHVFTWFAIGVVMAPTFILLFLGCTCLSINLWAIVHPSSLARCLRFPLSLLQRWSDRLAI
ncbi:MAG: hypothetical protein KME17_05890 [Cyanosarcina radialis HA8281-LM2]|jgi:hypothetical protein|nr:hypothetical protein [Cyanosarcina radialis HA8281-LM2]